MNVSDCTNSWTRRSEWWQRHSMAIDVVISHGRMESSQCRRHRRGLRFRLLRRVRSRGRHRRLPSLGHRQNARPDDGKSTFLEKIDAVVWIWIFNYSRVPLDPHVEDPPAGSTRRLECISRLVRRERDADPMAYPFRWNNPPLAMDGRMFQDSGSHQKRTLRRRIFRQSQVP